MAAFHRSGVILMAFAEGVGAPSSTMRYCRQRERDDGGPRLLSVEVVAAALEVHVGGSKVRVEPGFDAEHLPRVVRPRRAC